MTLKLNEILLCCGAKGCPILSKEKGGMVKIRDDSGGSVLLKEKEAELIHEALSKLKAK